MLYMNNVKGGWLLPPDEVSTNDREIASPASLARNDKNRRLTWSTFCFRHFLDLLETFSCWRLKSTKRYPTPRSVRMYLGLAGSSSNFSLR